MTKSHRYDQIRIKAVDSVLETRSEGLKGVTHYHYSIIQGNEVKLHILEGPQGAGGGVSFHELTHFTDNQVTVLPVSSYHQNSLPVLADWLGRTKH